MSFMENAYNIQQNIVAKPKSERPSLKMRKQTHQYLKSYYSFVVVLPGVD